MKPYRIKHKPTGLYYQPSANGNNLSRQGRVYLTNANPFSMNRGANYIWVSLQQSSRIYKNYLKFFPDLKYCGAGGETCRVPKSDFEIEYL